MGAAIFTGVWFSGLLLGLGVGFKIGKSMDK